MILSNPVIKTEVDENGNVSQCVAVCADCYPKRLVWTLFPAVKGLAVSHGTCRIHGQCLLGNYKARKAAQAYLAKKAVAA